MASSTNLLDLPLEVLDIVFTNLSFDDKLKLGRADKNLEAAFKFHIRDNYTKISSRTLPTEYWSEFLMICGSIVNEIDVNFLNVHYFDLIKQYCCNLKIIKGLYVKDCKCLAAKNLLGGLKSLESLEVTITNRNTAKVLHALQELSSLKKLMIKYLGASPGDCNSDVLIEPTSLDQAHIHKLINLEELVISSSLYRHPININDIQSQLKNLRSLTLSNIQVFSPIEDMEITLPSLEDLSISRSLINFQLPNCPKLRSLKFFNSHCHLNNVFEKWMTIHVKTLNSLIADSGIFNKKMLTSMFSSSDFKEWQCPEIDTLIVNSSEIKFPLPFCPKLKSLELSGTRFFAMNFSYNYLLYCPNLLSLNLECSEIRSPDYFHNWIAKHSNLQSLKLPEQFFEEHEFLHLLSRCKKLNKLKISTYDKNIKKISRGFLNLFIKILKQNGFTESKPFELTVSPNAFQEIQSMLDEIPGSALCKCFTIHIDGHVFLDPYDESDNDMMSISLNRLNSIITS
ncbi:uncharacterized protein LOC108099916 isoform X1 [Drosophila ficusphila]|uniref:uncharacterized protein LOC108099916 isoform X1 n=1 Tax=Drosophila ficusphila TaxID=30025 RepID=UPI0007E8748B|nr:uncharacterized protein LOC108099916 isoform X1 [Drosophila ficusphila]